MGNDVLNLQLLKRVRQLSATASERVLRIKKIKIKRPIKCVAIMTTESPHDLSVCNRLLFYGKCTGFTVCVTYSDISLSMSINQC